MGLDISLYRMSEITQKDLEYLRGKNLKEIKKICKDAFILFQTDFNERAPMYSDLKSVMQELEYSSLEFDILQIKKDRRLPKGLNCYAVDHFDEEKQWYLYWQDPDYPDIQENVHTMVLTDKQAEKYISYTKKICYICLIEEVRYWRGNTELQERIHKATQKKICNMGYYKVNKEMANVLVKYGVSKKFFSNNQVKDRMFYFEWY